MAQYQIIEKALGAELISQLYDIMDKVIATESSAIARVDLPEKKDWAA